VVGDEQGRVALFHSSPNISSKPLLLASLCSTTGSYHPSSNNNSSSSSSGVSLASTVGDVLIVVGGSTNGGLVQGYRWSDILANKKTTQLPSDIFSFDLAR
jgi:hypothetical protein